ncbi:phosphatidylinositol N-acetylglucosaminyltransferase subunit P-like [Hordeum vulgare subsp. vulgare]|uniref:phosphatidylinositol N-acetylglucosaminyltransferase subunit P-like n=1 Tax=Hordeum vulgare subsp. vulgare TaxID=112509 RepID=UPI001B849611|nr:phosphatidylinositol N-acetylglucosaminyltransferase subunit P-like [Hordeum vulgare subsp. vulgare]
MNKADRAGSLSKWAVLLTRASPDPDPLVPPVSTRREHQPTMQPAGSTESSPAAQQRSPRQAATARGHGTRHSEAYGFVGSIAASAAALAYIAWAYAPEPWLCNIGATYYPNKRWAVAVPAFVAVAVAQGVVMYVASNFLLAPPPASFSTISDEHAREPSSSLRTGADQAIEPITDIGIDRMNHLMFGAQGFHSLPRRRTQLKPSSFLDD